MSKLIGFTEEEFEEKVNPINKELVEDFLKQSHLSGQTLRQYKSALYIFCKWVYEECRNKEIPSLKPRDALRYQNFLIDNNLSSSGIKFKRSAVSSLCGFIEVYYNDEYPTFRNIFTKAIPNVAKISKKEKEPLTKAEIDKLIKHLKNKKDYQKLAYVMFSFCTGARREEVRQLLKEVTGYKKHKGKKYYLTHPIRCKGKGQVGEVRKMPFDEDTLKAIKKWIDHRASLIDGKDDCPYVFVSVKGGAFKQLSPNTFNLWCDEFSEIVGKKVHPHLFRSSVATYYSGEGKDIKSIQSLLGHKSSTTTEIYIVSEDNEVDDLFD